jgi:hypothetical protein
LSYPCKLGIKAILSTLPYKIKEQFDVEEFRDYVARCTRILTENTAKFAGGGYMKAEYSEIIKPKPVKKYVSGEITSKIRSKLG